MQTLSDVERASIKSLTPNARNARTHSPKQIRQIANSIEAFVFVNPVLVDEAGIILAGHGRVAAAKRLGIDEVPIVRIGHLSQAQKRAYVIADNQLALKAGWDDEILAIEFQALADLDFDLSLTGFDMGDIDRIIADIGGTSPPDAPLSPEDGPALTPPGDLWRIGPHRLICADALRAETYTRLMQGDEAELVLTDPPCNVPINGHVSGLGKAEPPRVRYGVGRDDAGRLSRLSRVGLRQIARRQLQWRNPFHLYGLATRRNAARRRRAGLRGTQKICVWVKANGGMGSLYRSQHELVFLFKAGTKPHINNINLGRDGRNRTNVWSYAGANGFSETREDDLATHPTVKPLPLIKDAILDCSNRGGIVLDAFAGSGATLLAAHETGRIGYGVEIAPLLRRRLETPDSGRD